MSCYRTIAESQEALIDGDSEVQHRIVLHQTTKLSIVYFWPQQKRDLYADANAEAFRAVYSEPRSSSYMGEPSLLLLYEKSEV